MKKALILLILLGSTGLPAPSLGASETSVEDTKGWWVKGRIQGYQGIWPLHVAALSSRDFADPNNPIGWASVDADTGRFDLHIAQSDRTELYLLAQLDRERLGPRLNGNQLFFLRTTPFERAEFDGKRLLFDLGDMELAHLIRDSDSTRAPAIALGLAVLLYGLGFLIVRRLNKTSPCAQPLPNRGGWPLWAIAIGTTIPLLPNLGHEALELLEFTYLHEALRPDSILALFTDPISAELSHPPFWPLVLRLLTQISHEEWWLRLPSVLCHLGYVFVVFRLASQHSARGMGLLAALLAGIAPISLYYGQDATPYALMGLLSASITLCALRERWKGFAALLIIGFFTHYTMAILGISIAISLLWYWRAGHDSGRLRRAFLTYGVICVLPLIWSVHFIRTFFASGMSTRLMSSDYLPDPGFLDYVGHFLAVVMGVTPEVHLGALAILVLVCFGIVRLFRTQPLLGRLMAVQVVLLIGYVVFVYAMYMRFADGRVFYAYRWTSVFLPAIAVGGAAAIVALWRTKKWLGTLVTIVLIVCALLQDGRILLNPKRPDQEAAAAHIQAEVQPGDAFCALPAIYYAQLFNYHLFDRKPDDWMAWPEQHGDLYGPFHQRNTTLETLSRNLAFRRIWVAVFHETMFDTRKFAAGPADHQLSWLKSNLSFNPTQDLFRFSHLDLYRFHVPHEPPDPEQRAWKGGRLELDFTQRIRLFRYFPTLLHSQSTESILSGETVDVRVPPPPFEATTLGLELEIHAREAVKESDLMVPGIALTFQTTDKGGIWRGQLPGSTDRIDLKLVRSAHLTDVHSNTIVRLTGDPNKETEPNPATESN
jgi:hypothetical protein